MVSRTLVPLIAALCLSLRFSNVYGFPMLAEIPEDGEKCLRFNVPKEEDAHMVFLPLPTGLSSEAEEWFVSQVYEMTKNRYEDGSLPRTLPEKAPEEFTKDWNDLVKKTGINGKPLFQIKLQKAHIAQPLRQHAMILFVPVVINHLERFQRKTRDWHAADESQGVYWVCFENMSEEAVQVVFEVVLASEDPIDDDAAAEEEDKQKVKKKHLTPLEKELAVSINAANNILSEMHYMEKREQRMRLTADSINQKIRWFSYISVIVLLGVTYLQVTYLKGYFKKKKLL